jgi:hypothetical protein
MPGPITPTYLAGKNGSVLINVSGTLVALPITNFSAPEESGSFDATNALTHGYEWPEATTSKCTFTADASWKKTGGAPPMKKGMVYAIQLNTQQLTSTTFEGYSGNGLILSVSTKSNVKGETMYSFSGQFQGVYNSPTYPTAIADSTATPPVGDFTPPA